jgi:site-specific DNA-adenine methylase
MIKPLFSYAGNKEKHLKNPFFVESVYGTLEKHGRVYDLAMGAGSVILNAPNGGYGYEFEPALYHIFHWLKEDGLIFAHLVEEYYSNYFSGFSVDDIKNKKHKCAYLSLRDLERSIYQHRVKHMQKWGLNHCAILTVLIQLSFNSLVRFSKYGFNVPVGLKPFSAEKVRAIVDKLGHKPYCFELTSLLDFDVTIPSNDDVVYIDPPYLVTPYKYGGWTLEEELAMYSLLHKLDDRGIKFVLSNVSHYKGSENSTLISFTNSRDSYIMYDIDGIDYRNWRFIDGVKTSTGTTEVIIRNF